MRHRSLRFLRSLADYKWLYALTLAACCLGFCAQSHAQSENYGWWPSYSGPGCYLDDAGGWLCGTLDDECQSIIGLYGVPWFDEITVGVPFTGIGGTYESGEACVWPWGLGDLIGGGNEFLPPGTTGDYN